jgi:hypothetical protein
LFFSFRLFTKPRPLFFFAPRFACCLEFVENGSLEDWLRRTAGGRAYDPSKKKSKKKKKQLGKGKGEGKESAESEDSPTPLPEIVHKGYDHDGTYDESLHTPEDKKQIASAVDLLQTLVGSAPSSWEVLSQDDGTQFGSGLQGWFKYNSATKWGEAVAVMPQINAKPAQVLAKHVHAFGDGGVETIHRDYTTRVEYMEIPFPAPFSQREMLYRGVIKKFDDGSFIDVSYSVEDDRKPAAGAKRMNVNYAMWVRPKEGSDGKASEVWRMLRVSPGFGAIVGAVMNGLVASKAVSNVAVPLVSLKKNVEELLDEYEPALTEDAATGVQTLTWKGQLLRIATDCALGVQYLHGERYWSDGNDKTGEEKEEAGWRECIIHRDLKPDNMLLTKEWILKLTDFGEARAIELNHTMTSVGTPIYVAPEVMAGYRYDATADSYSFGICLVAMIRAEKDIMEFYFQALRKTMKRKTKAGVGITILNNRMYSKGWRPLLPLPFKKAYPKMCRLIEDCWKQDLKERPNFDQIVARLQGEITSEVLRKEEPKIARIGEEDDKEYWDRLKSNGSEDYSDDDGNEEADMETVRRTLKTELISERHKHEEALEKVMKELKEKDDIIKRLREEKGGLG